MQFTHEGEIAVIVDLEMIDKSDTAEITFTVRDTGIGIKPEFLEHIFTPFSQGDTSTTRKYVRDFDVK